MAKSHFVVVCIISGSKASNKFIDDGEIDHLESRPPVTRSLRFSTFVEARANPDVGMQNHSSDGLIPQEREGCIPVVKVGAKRGTGIDSLLENIVLVAELQGLKANPDREAKGTVVNASLDNARGPLATLPVQNGTLLKEDFVLCGEAHVKVRILIWHSRSHAMEGLLEDVEEGVLIGEAAVSAVFEAGSRKASGCVVIEGKMVTGSGIHVMRKKILRMVAL
uniref:Elongation factor G-like domain-containing protein n=1 Tax=Physcomitrium patens TaxID=3218 RepID=A0A2K1L110_PHYPA|nr:hypothetical protein PHYPA_002510 [Physcomitrium patens]